MDTSLFGQIAVSRRYVTREQLDEALNRQRRHPGAKLGQILFDLGFLSTGKILEILGLQSRNLVICRSCGRVFSAAHGRDVCLRCTFHPQRAVGDEIWG